MKRPRILLADDHTMKAEALTHLLQADVDVVGWVRTRSSTASFP
jgi:DNA-binding NarL/FixJ family response regulator